MYEDSFSTFEKIRKDFPNISSDISYLDSAATAQKPRPVIDSLTRFYEKDYATVHRAIYSPAHLATSLYEDVRARIAKFLHAKTTEIIFTKGTTDGLNIIADSLSLLLSPGDVILVSLLEHHSNLVPWQFAARRSGAKVVPIPIDDAGELCLGELERLLSGGNVKIVALTHASNVIGAINPIGAIADKVHDAGAYLIVDGAQSTPHMKIDLQDLHCDAFAFSGHKMYGPSGIGVLYVKESLLEKLPPTRGGGDMVDTVFMEETTFAPLPTRFEPGTPPIAQVIGLGAALDYLESIGLNAIYAYEEALYVQLRRELEEIEEVVLLGPNERKLPLQSFVIRRCHPLDIATLLNFKHVYVRSGTMCCQPLLKRLGYSGVNRISLGLYNAPQDIVRASRALKEAIVSLCGTVFLASEQSETLQIP